MRRVGWLMLVAAVALVCFGCGRRKAEEALAEKIVENAIEGASGGETDVDLSGDTVTVKSKEGTMVMSGGGNVSLPDKFPKDVPVYKGAKVITSMSAKDGMSVTLQTADPLAKVGEFYKSRMDAQGWESETSLNTGNQTILGFKKESRSASVIMMASKEGGTTISLILADR